MFTAHTTKSRHILLQSCEYIFCLYHCSSRAVCANKKNVIHIPVVGVSSFKYSNTIYAWWVERTYDEKWHLSGGFIFFTIAKTSQLGQVVLLKCMWEGVVGNPQWYDTCVAQVRVSDPQFVWSRSFQRYIRLIHINNQVGISTTLLDSTWPRRWAVLHYS